MPATTEITETEQRIAEVDALQQTISLLREDLQAYSQALREELSWLQQEAAEPEPEPESVPLAPAPAPAQVRQPVAEERLSQELAEDDQVPTVPPAPERSPF